jgi:alkanesulfonate monooxygenase SsuD/methylene tetrahydromethanopterin reductase-like flavin-dependent oxidoreductase (luciferase family)
MLYGAHLPLIGFGDSTFSLEGLLAYARTAEDTGYTTLCMNDHLLFSRPWLDGPVALASVLSQTKRMKLATTVALPVIRGPVALAKTLAAIDLLSQGRLIIAVGPGSSARDYEAVGLPFEERWKRLDEAVAVMRRLLRRDGPHFRGRYYSSEGLSLGPYPAQPGGPPIWIGSWGSEAGLKWTAHLADGWLASAYNTTPEIFSSAWKWLRGLLHDFGKDPKKFPNALSTMFFYLTESKSVAERVLK